MKNIIQIFFNSIFIILFLFSVLIFISENTSTFNQKLLGSIEEKFLNSYNINTKIDSIKIKWEGINPSIHITSLNLNDERSNIILETPASVIRVDLLKSIYQMTVYINEIVINNTTISLIRDKSNIFMNDLNLMSKSNKSKSINTPKIVFKNSIIKLKDKSTNNTINFKINTLIASNNNNALNIDANFLHKSSSDPITLIYRGLEGENNNKSRVYISGNYVKLPYNLLPSSFKQIKSDSISFRVWIDLNDVKIKRIAGNISASKLDVKIPHLILKIKDVNSDIVYTNTERLKTIALTRLNYQLNDKKINNNKLVISKSKSEEIKVFVEKSSSEIIKILSKNTSLPSDNYLSKLENPTIKNLQIYSSKKDIIDYFVFTVDSPILRINNNYKLKDISFNVYGNLKKGRIQVNSLSLDNNNINYIKQMNGSITYNVRGKSIYFSSNDISDENGYRLSITGKKVSKYPSIKIEILGDLKEIANFLYPILEIEDLEVSGKLNSSIYYFNDQFFSKTELSKTYLNKADSIYLSADKINLYHSSNMIKSNKFTFNINKRNQTSSIDTIINSKSYKYIMTSIGEVETDLLSSFLKLDNNFLNGKSLVKSNLTYDKKSGLINLFASSDLRGISINFRKSSIKKTKDRLNTTLNYQYSVSDSYPIKISIDQHNLEIKDNLEYYYISIKSPVARGFLKYPKLSDKNRVLNGSFEYIDTSNLGGASFITSLPNIDIKSKYIKSNNIIFDNFHLIMKPMNEHIEITKLNFKNLHMEMRSSGKWFINDKMRTELLADIKSDNFGLALKTLGYPKTIKGGKLQAKLSGSWSGSIKDFSFSKTNGNLDFTIKEGQIYQLDKGTQAIGQVLGLFSISSIPKRLSLDFSDFFSTGLSFDHLNTEINLNSGIAHTQKMVITGSFGEMRLSGKSDLLKETHDQVLIFIPDLSSTSLVTGAVIGGPIGAVASIFYDKLLKEFGVDTNKLAGIEYSIKGPWKDPEIKVTQSFKPILN
jgi:hypothetical protein